MTSCSNLSLATAQSAPQPGGGKTPPQGATTTTNKKEEEQKKPKRSLLETGTAISSQNHRYIVVDLLGSGGFGDVYRVTKEGAEGGQQFALKTENNKVAARLCRLKMECEVLAECAKTKPAHFLWLVDRGKTADFKFIVMPICGRTLDSIRSKQLPDRKFTPQTAMKISIQMLESVRDLHAIGYLHRDLKPSNFAVGLRREEQHTIILIDFGISKRFVDAKGALIIPRVKVAFMGTPRFAPRSSHRLQERTRKCDLEALIYVMVDIFDETALPWRGQRSQMLVLQLKDNFMSEKGPIVSALLSRLPAELSRLIRYVEQLRFDTTPLYDQLLNELRSGLGADAAKPLDWLNRDLMDLKEQKATYDPTYEEPPEVEQQPKSDDKRTIVPPKRAHNHSAEKAAGGGGGAQKMVEKVESSTGLQSTVPPSSRREGKQ